MARRQVVNLERTFQASAKAFGTARMGKLSGYGGKNGTSTGTAREAEKLYLGMVEYTRLYGTEEQFKAISKMNPAKLRWMYKNDIIVPEEFFVYRDDIVPLADARKGIQTALNRYNALNNEFNRQRREARARKG